MDVAAWFPEFIQRHRMRHELMKLPALDANPMFYEPWRDEIVRTQMPMQALEQASKLLVSKRHYRNNHFNALMEMAWEVRRTLAGPSRADSAKIASRDCIDCYGGGMATVTDRETGMNFAAYCVCDFGRVCLGKAQRELKPHEVALDLASIRQGVTYQAVINGRTVTLDFGDRPEEHRTMPDDWEERLKRKLAVPS